MIDVKSEPARSEASRDAGSTPDDVPPPAYPSANSGQPSEVARGASSPATYPPPDLGASPQHPGSPHAQQAYTAGPGDYFPPQPQQPLPQPAPPSAPPMTAAQQQALVGQQYQQQLLAQCAQGHHSPTTSYGACGIITAICLFPIGLICLFSDTETKCSRCGVRMD